jgi:hypothetical protein
MIPYTNDRSAVSHKKCATKIADTNGDKENRNRKKGKKKRQEKKKKIFSSRLCVQKKR